MAGRAIRADHETLGLLGAVDVEHEPQTVARLRAGTNFPDGALPVRQTFRGFEFGVREVNDDAIGVVEREHVVLDGTADIQHEARAFRARPEAHVRHARDARPMQAVPTSNTAIKPKIERVGRGRAARMARNLHRLLNIFQ